MGGPRKEKAIKNGGAGGCPQGVEMKPGCAALVIVPISPKEGAAAAIAAGVVIFRLKD